MLDSPAGTFFVDLTKVADSGSVVSAFVDGVARAVLPERSAERHLFTELAGAPVLIVVDNCEHVVDEVAEFIGRLLVEVVNVSVLATSRVVMDVDDEHVVPLPPLRTDSRSSAAVELFVERALAVDRTLDFDDTELATITAIVTRLDGLPLAIELAAARSERSRPHRSCRSLDERFRLLVGLRRRDPASRVSRLRSPGRTTSSVPRSNGSSERSRCARDPSRWTRLLVCLDSISSRRPTASNRSSANR